MPNNWIKALKEYNKALIYLPDLEDAIEGKAKLSKTK